MSALTRCRTLKPSPAAIMAADILRELKTLQAQDKPDRDRLGELLAIADEVF